MAYYLKSFQFLMEYVGQTLTLLCVVCIWNNAISFFLHGPRHVRGGVEEVQAGEWGLKLVGLLRQKSEGALRALVRLSSSAWGYGVFHAPNQSHATKEQQQKILYFLPTMWSQLRNFKLPVDAESCSLGWSRSDPGSCETRYGCLTTQLRILSKWL